MSDTSPAEPHAFIADSKGARFYVVGAHLSDEELVGAVNRLVHRARENGETTWFDREITAQDAHIGFRV